MRTLTEFLTQSWRKQEICESCGNEFTCGATLAGCWCAGMKLTEIDRTHLRSRFTRCVCRNCLETLTAHLADNEDPKTGPGK